MGQLRRVLFAIALAIPACAVAAPHTADQNADHKIELNELLRVIQFYNSGGFHCEVGTEDGYAPGPGAQGCAAHSADYNPRDWKLSLTELLRVIQMYNSGGYSECTGSEDGFCAVDGLRRKNVVLIVIDTLRARQIDASRDGVAIMPFLSEYAKGGARFTRATSNGSWTPPSLTALIAGRWPDHYDGPVDPNAGTRPGTTFPLPLSDTTIEEWLAANGYDPWCIHTNLYGTDQFGHAQGYPAGHLTTMVNGIAGAITDSLVGREGVSGSISEWVEPFFVYAHYIDPHAPYNPPMEDREPFAPLPVLTGMDKSYLELGQWGVLAQDMLFNYFGADPLDQTPLSETGIAAVQYLYDAECRYVDREVGRMITAVEQRYPDTLFVVVADHGEALFERDIAAHGHTVFEELSHVPLIFHGPNVEPAVIERRVNTVGILPTLAQLLDLPPLPEWEGHDLLDADFESPVFCYTKDTFLDHTIEASSVTDGDLKLIDDSKLGVLLFDLANDPGELNNLGGTHPDVVARLMEILNAHRAVANE